jgi:disulfide bond formation protein DsbB
MEEKASQQHLFFIFVISALATLGSLFFSVAMKLPPCDLCWYQRICMYPVLIISLVGLARNATESFYFILPLALIGTGIAIYHNLLYYNVIENIVPCSQGVSCTSRQLQWLGFITIPLMSLVAFLFVLVACLKVFFKMRSIHEK